MKGIGRAAVFVLAMSCGRISFDAVSLTGDRDGPGSDPDLVLWYPLDTDPSSGVIDASGNGHHGACVAACPAMMSAGKLGGAYTFDGLSTATETPDAFDLHLVAGTITLWARIETLPSGVTHFLSKPFGVSGLNTWEITVENFATLRFGGDSTGMDYIFSVMQPAKWTHLAMVWDSTQLLVYVDGVFDQMTAFIADYDSNSLFLGADSEPALGSYLDGSIDDVRIYRRALSAAEVASLAQ